jgi:hypothetical protein
MRSETDRAKIDAFMNALAERVRRAGRVYFTGGGTAVCLDGAQRRSIST